LSAPAAELSSQRAKYLLGFYSRRSCLRRLCRHLSQLRFDKACIVEAAAGAIFRLWRPVVLVTLALATAFQSLLSVITASYCDSGSDPLSNCSLKVIASSCGASVAFLFGPFMHKLTGLLYLWWTSRVAAINYSSAKSSQPAGHTQSLCALRMPCSSSVVVVVFPAVVSRSF